MEGRISSAENLTARDKVKYTIDEIIRIVEASPGDASKEIRRQKLRDFINPVFDFAETAKRSLGIYWKEASAEEQKEFISAFSDNLARTYLSKIETVKPGMVTIESENPGKFGTMVVTNVLHKGQTYELNYRLHLKEGKWLVYDVVIEEIGLISKNRNEFAGVIRKEGIAGLIKRLKETKSKD